MEPNFTDEVVNYHHRHNDDDDEGKHNNNIPSRLLPINILGLSLVCATPMLLGFLYGYDIGATSFVLQILLMDDDAADSYDYDYWWSSSSSSTTNHLSSLQQGLFVSAVSLGALIGSHCIMTLPYYFKGMGRRMELRVAAGLYTIGTCINIFGSGTVFRSYPNFGFYALLLGRTLFGIGVGFVMHGAPAYLAEMCPPQIRGAVVSAKETIIVSGIVVGYAVGNLLSHNNHNDWTRIYAMKFWLEVPLFALTFYIPRSKRWLLLQGNVQEAEASMRFIYNVNKKGGDDDENFRRAFAELAKQVDETMTSSSSSSSSSTSIVSNIYQVLLSCPEYRSALVASMGLILCQQISGQPSILSYATVLLGEAGWNGTASVGISVLMMVMSTVTVLFVDRVGRKPLLKLCCGVMMVASLILGLCLWYIQNYTMPDEEEHQHEDEDTTTTTTIIRHLILIALCVYIGGYQIGFGPVTWCIVSEVFPLEIKSIAIAICVEWNYLLNFGVQFGLPILQSKCGGWDFCFGIFAIVLGWSYFFVDRYVPETRGLTLEEIQWKLQEQEQQQRGVLVVSEQEEEEGNGGDDEVAPPMETTGLLTQSSR